MKILGINYGTSTASLGREDINAPIRIAESENKLLSTAVDIVEKEFATKANDAAVRAAEFQTKFGEFVAYTKGRQNYTTKELRNLGIKYDKEYDETGIVPAYVASPQVFNKMSKSMFKSAAAVSSPEVRNLISKVWGRAHTAANADIIRTAVETSYSLQSVESELAFDNSVNGGDLDGALQLSQVALATNIWSPKKFKAKTSGMHNTIRKNQYVQQLDNSDDLNILDSMQGGLFTDSVLNPETKINLYKMYESKIKSISSEQKLVLNKAVSEQSYQTFVDKSTEMLSTGQPMAWDDLQRNMSSMTNADGKALLTINRMMSSKNTTYESDPDSLMSITIGIMGISNPVKSTTLQQRRNTQLDNLNSLAGYDPITMSKVGNSKISVQDYMKLHDKINASTEFEEKNPNNKRISDSIWMMLTGASKDLMTSILGNAPDTINALQAESEFTAAIADQGSSFDPDAWWATNSERFLTKSIDNAGRRILKKRLRRYIVPDFNSPTGMNLTESISKLQLEVKNKKMDINRAKEIANQLREFYDKKAALLQSRSKRSN